MRVLLAQLAPAERDVAANCRTVCSTTRAAGDVDLVVFPELFLSGYRLGELEALALAPDGPEVVGIRTAAAASGCAVVVGFAERVPGGVANGVLCVDRSGELAGVFRKTHLFGAERTAMRAGDSLAQVTIAGLRAGVMVCFDLEFPEVARALAVGGAELLLTVAANMEPFAADHELFSRVRALENGLPLVYVNRVGSEDGLRFVGGSRAVDAAGQVLADAGEEPRLLEVDVPLGGRREARLDYLAQRRQDLYGAGPPGIGSPPLP